MIKKLKIWEANFTVGRAAAIIGIFTFATKISALLRERLFASTFGQGQISDAYFSAFRIPDFVTNLFVLSTLSVAFLPVFSRERNKNINQANDFADVTLNIALGFIGSLCLILLIFSRPLTKLLVPGFAGDQFGDTLNLTRLFLITPIIFAASTIFGGILNAYRKFLITSFAPILYNLGIIFGIIFLYPKFGIMGLGYGVILGAIAQLIIQGLNVFSRDFKWHWNINSNMPAFKHMLDLYLPRILTFDLANVTLLLSTILASKAYAGSITAINQSFNLQAVPIGIFAYALSAAVFPALADHFSEGNEKAYITSLKNTMRQILFFMIPITIFMIIFRAFIVRLILGSGNFNWENTITTFTFLGIFSIALVSQSLTTLFSRAFYARHNTKIPVIINLWSIGLNVILSYLLFMAFKVEGLVISFVVSSIFNAGILYIKLRGQLWIEAGVELVKELQASVLDSLKKIITASMVSGLVSYLLIYLVEPFVDTDKFFGILIQVLVAGSFGVLTYIFLTIKMRLPESEMAIKLIRKAFGLPEQL